MDINAKRKEGEKDSTIAITITESIPRGGRMSGLNVSRKEEDLLRRLYPKTADRMIKHTKDPGFDFSTRDELIDKFMAKGLNKEYAEAQADHDLFLKNVYAKSPSSRPPRKTSMDRMRENESKLSHEYVCSILEYNPETGVITNKVDRGVLKHGVVNAPAGKIAGHVTKRGYRRIQIDGISYSAHRLEWFMHYGKWPTEELDHKYGERDDNRIENLQEATSRQNQQNQKIHRIGRCPGVCWHKRHCKWHARVQVAGKDKHLGYFNTEEEAFLAYADYVHDVIGQGLPREPIDWEAEYLRLKKKEA